VREQRALFLFSGSGCAEKREEVVMHWLGLLLMVAGLVQLALDLRDEMRADDTLKGRSATLEPSAHGSR
jgi:hypothetical protein